MVRFLKILFPILWCFLFVSCCHRTPEPIQEYKLCTVIDRFQTIEIGTQAKGSTKVQANVFNTACRLKSGEVVVTQNPIEFYASHPAGTDISVLVTVDYKTYPYYDYFNIAAWAVTIIWLVFSILIPNEYSV